MRLRRLTNQIAQSILFTGLCWNCTFDRNAEPSVIESVVKKVINVSLNTYSGDSNTLPAELLVKSAYVYIYNNLGILENRDQVYITPIQGGIIDNNNKLNGEWRVATGTKEVYVVVNPDAELATRLTSSLTKAQLLKLTTTQSAWSVERLETNGLLMSGHTTLDVSSATTTATVPITRRHARIDFNLKKAADLAAVTVKLKFVTLSEQEQVGSVFADGTGDYVSYTATNPSTNELISALTIGDGFTTSALNFYTFPHPAAQNPTALSLQMVVDINGVEKTVDAYINSGALNGNSENNKTKPLEISSNSIYKVQVTLSRQSVDVGIYILDWESTTCNTPIYGATLELDKVSIVMDCNIITNKTAVILYKSNTLATVKTVTPQPSWLEITPSIESNPNLSGTITLRHVAKEKGGTNSIPESNKTAIISVEAGGITRHLKVYWGPDPSIL